MKITASKTQMSKRRNGYWRTIVRRAAAKRGRRVTAAKGDSTMSTIATALSRAAAQEGLKLVRHRLRKDSRRDEEERVEVWFDPLPRRMAV